MMIERFVEYEHDGVVLQGFLAFEADSDIETVSKPGVLVSHAWAGRSEFECDKARELAKLGYVGFALDVYGKGVLGQSVDENSQLMQPFIDNRQRLQDRLVKALHVLQAQPEVDNNQLAIMGYCFGGLCALDLARVNNEIKAAVSFHGLLGAPDNTTSKHINAKILVLHGNEDPMVPADSVVALQNELTKAQADWQIHSYGGAMHAFTNPLADDVDFGVKYNSAADKRSWQAMRNLLAEVFV